MKNKKKKPPRTSRAEMNKIQKIFDQKQHSSYYEENKYDIRNITTRTRYSPDDKDQKNFVTVFMLVYS